ncbi:MAG: 5'/3'-nucleotidase SurE [Bacteroidales bacterium]
MGLEILITNDDGYTAKGINVLTKILAGYGNVTVVAPRDGQSGMASALTLDKPLRLQKTSETEEYKGNLINRYSLTGTPADCVKMAMHKFFKESKPDLLVSGINHGANTSAGSVYSGTLGACMEGTLYGIHSIGFSLDSHDSNADFTAIEDFIRTVLNHYLTHPAGTGIFLNVNFPYCPADKIKGIKFASQGNGLWIKEFSDRTDPRGNEYYWMSGEFLDTDTSASGDHRLLSHRFITIVPHQVNTTDYQELARLAEAWKLQ